MCRFFTNVIYVWLEGQFTVEEYFQQFYISAITYLSIFYLYACFYVRASDEMTLIWVSFHLVVSKPLEMTSSKSLRKKKGVLSSA